MWIYLHFLARVDEGAVLSDSALSGSTAADAIVSGCSSSALGPLLFHGSCAVVFGDPTGSSWWWAHERLEQLELVSRSGSCLPSGLVVRPSYVGWALVSTLVGVPSGTGTYQYFSSFGEGGRCHLTCSYPHFFTIACLIFSLFRDPNALRTEILLQPWKGCQE